VARQEKETGVVVKAMVRSVPVTLLMVVAGVAAALWVAWAATITAAASPAMAPVAVTVEAVAAGGPDNKPGDDDGGGQNPAASPGNITINNVNVNPGGGRPGQNSATGWDRPPQGTSSGGGWGVFADAFGFQNHDSARDRDKPTDTFERFTFERWSNGGWDRKQWGTTDHNKNKDKGERGREDDKKRRWYDRDRGSGDGGGTTDLRGGLGGLLDKLFAMITNLITKIIEAVGQQQPPQQPPNPPNPPAKPGKPNPPAKPGKPNPPDETHNDKGEKPQTQLAE
jgi:hypothetical protein